MFLKDIYVTRRNKLKEILKSGLVLVPGNNEIPMNYRDNTYRFRQDSTFLYFFGLNQSNLFGLLDLDSGDDILFGNNIDMEDIIWMGNLPSIEERGLAVGVKKTLPLAGLNAYIEKAQSLNRKIHFIHPYHAERVLFLSALLGIKAGDLKDHASHELIKAIVELRSTKGSEEIEEIDRIVNVAGKMHTTAMRMAKQGIMEREIAGVIEGIALSEGAGTSFPIIATRRGETLHNHYHGNVLKEGDLFLVDAGAEAESGYASDITRTCPVGGRFTSRQREIYEIVLAANLAAIAMCKPGVYYRDVHLKAAETIAEGLKAAGLMKGNTQDAVAQGAHALFFPHGLGHAMGLDVHDMENYGENLVGYDHSVQRSNQFGLAYLRFARELKPGFVLTDEPGIYFIPALIDQWKAEKKFTNFINYDKVEQYKDFGGIRIEDDILITANGCRVMGNAIPKSVSEVEEIAGKGI